MNKHEKEIFDLYDKLNIGKSEICKNCKFNNELSKPISIWQVGDNYHNSEHKILFVGKVARGELEIEYNNFLMQQILQMSYIKVVGLIGAIQELL